MQKEHYIKYSLLYFLHYSFVSLFYSDLRWKEGECSFNEESHQPFGVEDELISVCLFIPVTHYCNHNFFLPVRIFYMNGIM